MNRLPKHARFRPGFTLTELLVVVTIIGILAAMVSGALIVARNSAREAATRATIAKLHNIIMAKYESYRTRRVPLSDSDIFNVAVSRFGYTGGQPVPPRWVALVRLAALRDLMRMEMPERWSDIWDFTNNVPRGAIYLTSNPSLFQAYISRCSTISGGNYTFLPADSHYPAKCLYLIVTMGGGPDARRQFSEGEIAVDPSDGFSMFIDGWGRPIHYLRWAPGFNESDLQPNVPPMTVSEAATQDHDPFDTRRLDSTAWRLVPLIYSAGRDGEYGLWSNQYDEDRTSATTYYWLTWNQAYSQITDRKYNVSVRMGQPIPLDNAGTLATTHFDNIHNHQSLTEAR